MNALPSPSSAHRPHCPDPAMDTLLGAVWQSLQQSPPPNLREILDAYRAKGDGDRDMLIAMLNAKSAEDQRIASLASLQKSMLDLYQPSLRQPQVQAISPLHIAEPSHAHVHSQPHSHYAHSHHPRSPYPPTHQYHASAPHMPSPPPSYHHHPSRSPPPHALDDRGRPIIVSDPHETLDVSQNSRKRRRSRSPASTREHPHYRSQDRDRDLPLPPSPYSSSSQSSGGSPRSRDSMAIGALLSARGEDSSRRLGSGSAAREHA
ncbi:uncharacterized protein C8Q71DRAFT_97894 [Rhodofomes roseus]|uniref:Uncharacterized protein n=1 Tax=Rhodofomes roseus TaxID=34475 RepID=A0ABQ8KE43_9APHY|nr:uncharacterized protein C8Q71DRAFT_97894 [Rhodofomes roseus]KAH9835817.1 hypothetical protein C8Q71DRAFT_97894 [Rhodofomes roseus]